jgi:hypothetical protein
MGSLNSKYCPVCGFYLDFYPWVGKSPSDEICPCCGIQFGNDDMAGGDINKRRLIYYQWKQQWITEKMPWRSMGITPPKHWNPQSQVRHSYPSLPRNV